LGAGVRADRVLLFNIISTIQMIKASEQVIALSSEWLVLTAV
jgi:hypothetical protein